jgi:hypothetical protein
MPGLDIRDQAHNGSTWRNLLAKIASTIMGDAVTQHAYSAIRSLNIRKERDI